VAEPVEGDLISTTVCLSANALGYTTGGGHLWVYLNWALGLRALGCQVVWLEAFDPDLPAHEVRAYAGALRGQLERYGLAEYMTVCSFTGEPLLRGGAEGYLDLEAAAEADLLLNLKYFAAPELVGRFRRSALVDIDPGLLQTWMSKGVIDLPRHDVYFTTGETVGQPGSRIPDVGLRWQYAPPCVALDWWPPRRAADEAPFTTVAHWYMDEWEEDAGELYSNDKRTGFLPFLDLPQRTAQPLELALRLAGDYVEQAALEERGWRVREAGDIAPTPWHYQRYIQGSRGEFSCVKPSCVRLQNSWISDRTLCYLASGKPAVVEHTGPSRVLPDSEGLFRFRDVEEAVRSLERVAGDYERQCALARALAEEHFDAQKVVGSVLERALP
jgi:hypothetical protein